jgi:hypothetical protein
VSNAGAQQLAVVRVGDGIAALTSAATPAFVERRTPTGSLISTLALPTAESANNHILTLSGTATTEGHIRLSSNGQFVTLAGYDAAPGTVAVPSTVSTSTQRVVGRIDMAGNVDTSTLTDAFYSGGNIRGAFTDDGTRFWTTGSNDGVILQELGLHGTAVKVLATPGNVRVPAIFGGQLYVSSGSNGFAGVSAVGTGLPVAATTATLLPGLPTSGASPGDFMMFDMSPGVPGLDRMYVADDRASGSGGGIQRWNFDGITWSLSATFQMGTTVGVRGLAGRAAGTSVVLYATTAEATSNTIVTLTDDGVTASPAVTVLATAPTNTAYRGIDLVPAPSTPTPAMPGLAAWTMAVALALAGAGAVARRSIRLRR